VWRVTQRAYHHLIRTTCGLFTFALALAIVCWVVTERAVAGAIDVGGTIASCLVLALMVRQTKRFLSDVYAWHFLSRNCRERKAAHVSSTGCAGRLTARIAARTEESHRSTSERSLSASYINMKAASRGLPLTCG